MTPIEEVCFFHTSPEKHTAPSCAYLPDEGDEGRADEIFQRIISRQTPRHTNPQSFLHRHLYKLSPLTLSHPSIVDLLTLTLC